MKKQTGKMLIQNMKLKVGERFKVGRYVMVYAGNDGSASNFDVIVPLKVWKKMDSNHGATDSQEEI
jgi:hypothetical protein